MRRLLVILLLLSGMAFAQGGAINSFALKCDDDFVADGATVRVCTEGATGTPCSPTVSLYSDATLVTPLANPTVADACGNITGIYVAPGNYKLQVSGTGLVTRTDVISVPAPAHNLLSTTHSDVTAASVARGSLIAGIGASPKWTKVTLSGTGSYPKLDAAGDIVDSTLAASGVGTCTSQFVTGLSSDAAPTCETPGTEDVSAGLKTHTLNFTLFDPVTGDSGRIQFELPKNATITRVYCNVKAATSVTIQLNKRTEGAPDTPGTDILTSSLACDTNGETTTSFASSAITLRTPFAVTISAVTGTPDTLRGSIEYTVDNSQ